MKTTVLRNQNVCRVVIGVPQGHQHIRTIIETKHERLIFQEATIANLVRAYITLKTHPTQLGIELMLKEITGKEGYTRFQLLESLKSSTRIQTEMAQLITNNTQSQ
jgi:hypothetical protein